MAYYLNGVELEENQPFTVGDLTYPWSFLEVASKQKLATMGITNIPSIEYFDSRYYWRVDVPRNLEDEEVVDQNGNPAFEKTYEHYEEDGRMLVRETITDRRMINKGLKTNCVAEIKQTTNNILSKTDWYIYRKAERNIDVPENVVTHRAAIITESNRLETAILAVDNVEGLISIMNGQNWDKSLEA